jgi:hypothetical protein
VGVLPKRLFDTLDRGIILFTTGTNWRLARYEDSRPPTMPPPRARSVQGVVERRLRPYLFGPLVFLSYVLHSNFFGLFSMLVLL